MLTGPYPIGLKLGQLKLNEVETLAKRNFLIHTIKYGVSRSLSIGRPHESFVPIFMHSANLLEYSHFWEIEKDRLYVSLTHLDLI